MILAVWKLQLWIRKKIILCLEFTTVWVTILKGHSTGLDTKKVPKLAVCKLSRGKDLLEYVIEKQYSNTDFLPWDVFFVHSINILLDEALPFDKRMSASLSVPTPTKILATNLGKLNNIS